ncbi:MAG TPA: crosslink repair DNA glycosylase YcaQ family protein, partial [Polyangiaceae bacterium]|nr:crosslink repair DNA glycosylase YcaQ family protein [Polyangiaceae bacterium]
MPRDVLSQFREPTRAWFARTFGQPTRVQTQGWNASTRGESALLLAPTGSGKTLAAFLYAIDRLMEPRAAKPEPPPGKRRKRVADPEAGVRVLYISPLKALAVDVEKNLRAPLAGIAQVAEASSTQFHLPTVQIRTGDTPSLERSRMVRTPPDILITTPESLYLLLTSGARSMLRNVETVIVDEIHTMVATKRGAHLALSLERLEALKREPTRRIQRIGLSATQRPLDEVARLLGGLEGGTPRPVTLVDAGEKKKLALRVEVPDIDLSRLGELDEMASGPAAGGSRRSIWPSLHERLVELVRAHRSTMIFVNSRRLAERLAAALNELAGEELALAHHGSIAREKRTEIEDRLKSGELRSIVSTSSLELGIDMGAVDLVVQIEAPLSIASGLQRVGRASHAVDGVSTGVIFPKHRQDLVAAAAAVECMREGEVENTFYPRNPLDVLAQQLVAICSEGERAVDDLFALVRRAAPFAELPRNAFEGVLDMLSGRYPSDDFSELRPRVTWDRVGGKLEPRHGAAGLAIANGGTIPDRGLYGVFLRQAGATNGKAPKSHRVGELDEEMVFELKEGEVFLLGASSWRVDEIAFDRVMVVPAPGEPGKMPFWHGDRPGRSHAFGNAVGALTRTVAERPEPEAVKLLEGRGLDHSAAANCAAFVHEELRETGQVPSDRAIVVERFVDEIGDHRVCVLTPFGARVHAPWATAVLSRLRAEHATVADAVWSDDGMAFRLSASSEPPGAELFLPGADEVEDLVTAALSQSPLFAARFRENAARALLLPRRHPGKRTALWAQRKRAGDLLAVASRYPAFPILLETYRECLRDVFDLTGLVDVLTRVRSRSLRVHTVDVVKPSPFAASLLFSFVANFIYDGDSPLAERRAQALTIDHAQLRELLGEAELRSLLDPATIDEHVAVLQRRTRPIAHGDALHDLLLAVGELSEAEIRERLDPAVSFEMLTTELVAARRIMPIRVASEPRWAAAEDAARFRDVLGIPPPRGLPSAFLSPTADAPGDLVSRYARTHGPFTASDVARRFGMGEKTAMLIVERLVESGKLVEGAFLDAERARGEREFCETGVLKSLRRKSLAHLRKEIEPVEADVLGRFLLEWHAIGSTRKGPDALLAVVTQLEGMPLSASELEREILPTRLPGFRPWDLDALCASGEVVWAGVGALGPADGRIALYLAEHEPLLALPVTPVEGDAAAAIRALLEKRGAVFFSEIARVVGSMPSAVLATLWSMVWAGEVTNDTCEALRSYSAAQSATKQRGPRPGRARPTRSGPPGSEGRWSLRGSRWDRVPTETERRAALARALLERHGVVTREAIDMEGIKGGFSSVYDVLKTMEESGRIRRGYFVAGRGATQFALPGADERLRDARRSADDVHRTVVLAATDPANPYGAVIPWPELPATENDRPRLQRATGAKVVLHDGALVGFLSKSNEALLTFLPPDEPARSAAASGLAGALNGLVAQGKRRALLIASIDGLPPNQSAMNDALVQSGFHPARNGAL